MPHPSRIFRSSPIFRPSFRRVAAGVLVAALVTGGPGGAGAGSAGSSPTARVPPVLDPLTAPFTESELGSAGCLAASVAVGGIMVYFMGGLAPLAASMRGGLAPPRVLEGAAAAAFVFSSACYVGQALAPLMILTGTAVMDRLGASAVMDE